VKSREVTLIISQPHISLVTFPAVAASSRHRFEETTGKLQSDSDTLVHRRDLSAFRGTRALCRTAGTPLGILVLGPLSPLKISTLGFFRWQRQTI